MDHRMIYRYRFDEMLRVVKDGWQLRGFEGYDDNQIIDICGNAFRRYQSLIYYKEKIVLRMIIKLITNIMDIEGMPYNIPENEDDLFFICNENKCKAYILQYRNDTQLRLRLELLRNDKRIDKAKVFFLQKDYQKTIKRLSDIEGSGENAFFEFHTIKDLFDEIFGVEEYFLFSEYVESFNNMLRSIIYTKAIDMPSNLEINRFKITIANMLCKENYDSLLSNNIVSNQKNIIIKNYVERKRFLIMTGNALFADSFVSSEWYYRVHVINDELDQTGLVTGYIKSIEQLLYALIRLFINSNKHIRVKDLKNLPTSVTVYNDSYIEFSEENEPYIDTTLGSLALFVKYYNKDKRREDLFEVDAPSVQQIVESLFEFGCQDKDELDRNDLLHKKNLYSNNDIDKIRKKVLRLYCLLLGAFRLSKDRCMELMEYDKVEFLSPMIDEDLNCKIAGWAVPILLFDVPKQAGKVVFRIRKTTNVQEKIYEIYIEAKETISGNENERNDKLCRVIYSGWTQKLRWVVDDMSIDKLEGAIINLFCDVEISIKLREFGEVVIDNMGEKKTIYKRKQC